MKKMLPILVIVVAVGGLAFSQVYVSPGDGTLTAAIAAAQDGDVLQLVPGALYTESTEYNFGTIQNIDLTIEVDGDGSTKPIVQVTKASDSEADAKFFKVGDQASLTLRGLEFDGTLNEDINADILIEMYMGEFATPITIKKIKIENCYIHHLKRCVLQGDDSDLKYNVVVDSTFLDNVVVENTRTPVMYKNNGANYLSVRNCTFYKINRYGLRVAGPVESGFPDNTPRVIIDQTTWYDIGIRGESNEILLLEKGPNLNPWTVTNSIFVKQVSKTKTCINLKENPGPSSSDDNLSTIKNICWWDVGKINFRAHTVSDTISMDPEFADPENGDFTLPVGSILLTYGTEGGPIGDLRWATNATPVEGNLPIPGHFTLDQNYPNPFNPTTTITFHLDRSGPALLTVYDLLGHEIATLVDGNLSAGDHRVTFDASRLTSGIYFYRLKSAGQNIMKKMMLLE